MNTEFNLKMLVSIKILDIKESNYYYYFEKIIRTGFLFSRKKSIESGIYENHWNGEKFLCTKDEFPSNLISEKHLLIDEIVYIKPRIFLNFLNEESKTLYFNSLIEAKMEYDWIKKECKTTWI